MQKYLKKTDWGEYWVNDSSLDNNKIINLSFNVISKINVAVFDIEKNSDQSKIPDLNFYKLHHNNFDELATS